MLNISVRSRLIALVLGMAALLLLVGGLGFHASSSAVNELKEIYEHQTIPMRELARLRRLQIENEGHVFRAFQHNPSFEYAKLHDHQGNRMNIKPARAVVRGRGRKLRR